MDPAGLTKDATGISFATTAAWSSAIALADLLSNRPLLQAALDFLVILVVLNLSITPHVFPCLCPVEPFLVLGDDVPAEDEAEEYDEGCDEEEDEEIADDGFHGDETGFLACGMAN